MLRKNITHIIGLVMLFVTTSVYAEISPATILNVGDEPEGITYILERKSYSIVYESLDVNGLPILFKTEYVPPTRISPKSYTRLSSRDELIKYQFIFSSSDKDEAGLINQQDIINAEIKLTDGQVLMNNIEAPNGWHGVYDASVTNSVGWFLTSPDVLLSIQPGKSLSGFAISSYKLPGVVPVRFRGKAPTLGLSGAGPGPRGALGDQLDSILKKDYVFVYTSGPVINNPLPFNSVVILGSMKLHTKELTGLNYITESLYIEVSQIIDAAINAINLKDEEAAEDFLEELSRLVGVKDDDHESDEHHDDHESDEYHNSLESSDISPEINSALRRAYQFNINYIKHRL